MKLRRIHTVRRILKSGFINLFRNAWLSIAAMIVMVVALSIISMAVILNVTANNAISELARDLKASMYIRDGVSREQIDTLQSALAKLDFVEAVEFIDQDQAKQDLAGDFRNDEEILQALSLAGEDVLPSSFSISVNDLERMSELETFASDERYRGMVESVSLGQVAARATIDKAAAAQSFINVGSILAASVLSVVSIMIIFNTIRMAIYTRRDELRIMKLIGATPDYIRGPFLVEAGLYGVSAGIIAHAGVYALVFSLGGKISEQAEFAGTYAFMTMPSVMIAMWFIIVIMGILIGFLSCMLAMEKHLKLKHR